VVPLRKIRFSSSEASIKHYFHVPSVVEFLDGTMQSFPKPAPDPTLPGDYEASDPSLVFAAASNSRLLPEPFPPRRLAMPLTPRSIVNLTPRNQLAIRSILPAIGDEQRLPRSRQPRSPIFQLDNGEETDSSTDTGFGGLRFFRH